MIIPVFPLNGAVLFPKTNLPLNIFEKKYLDMVNYSLSNHRLVGMIQHRENGSLFNIGCYGKITVFNETKDNRYLINLEGVNCYKIISQIKTSHKFRLFKIQKVENFSSGNIEDSLKPKILEAYKKYLKLKNINLNLDDITRLNLDDVLKYIVMISPFDINIKQMLLELKTIKELYKNILSIIEMELVPSQGNITVN